ncbi:SCP2 domain-containing protein [Affinibrenneria salicis]|uniref:Ubiquinone biosynthesis accessory factor UbiJ n=1 Tax=Affinibrenneria salicis TaxID=2590031 RepID=A0A5J5FUQ0_9GAMM|nr:SCP2 domain-containing protein [Affinibrenneria salicis]KAA8997272.1 SCP2 domain-containing protein [Affinibrenneria salicis]
MLISTVLTAALETALNPLLFRDRSMKAARQRLQGKILAISLAELDTPLVFLFSESRLDVLSAWDGAVDCQLNTRVGALMKLRDRQQLSSLMRSGELLVEGDLQVAQQFVALLDLAEFDPAEWLSPWLGDIAAQGLTQALRKGVGHLTRSVDRQRRHLAEALTEEWRLAPGALETAWFNDEVGALQQALDRLTARLEKLEAAQ